MKKLHIGGTVIIDTEANIVSGSATIKSTNSVSIVDIIKSGDKQGVFSLDTTNPLLINDGMFSVGISCYDDENNTYVLNNEHIVFSFEESDKLEFTSQYILNTNCILNKDLVKLMYS